MNNLVIESLVVSAICVIALAISYLIERLGEERELRRKE